MHPQDENLAKLWGITAVDEVNGRIRGGGGKWERGRGDGRSSEASANFTFHVKKVKGQEKSIRT